MANTLKLQGIFGFKETYNVTAATVTTGWYAGQLFKIATAPTSIAQGFVALQTTSGSAVLGVAMENSSDVTSPVFGMTQPSGSKVTLLQGHSRFEITNGSTTKCYEQGSTKGNMEAASLMGLVYCSANGNFTSLYGTKTSAGGATVGPAMPIGFITKVPTAANNYTLGVVLFG
jgi:hypothetical protein